MSKRIRIKHSKGMKVLTFTGTTELGLLKAIIEEETGIPPFSQKLFVGYPSKELFKGHSDSEDIWAIGLRPNDQIMVSKAGSDLREMKDGIGIIVNMDKAKAMTHYVVARSVPADNSCLFHSALYILENKARGDPMKMRKKVADVVAAYPRLFNKDYLGMSNESYCANVVSPDFWGGAIELSIISFLYNIELRTFDMKAGGKMYSYGSDEKHARVAFLLYINGNHYEPMAVSPYGNAPESLDQVIFSSKDTVLMEMVERFIKSRL